MVVQQNIFNCSILKLYSFKVDFLTTVRIRLSMRATKKETLNFVDRPQTDFIKSIMGDILFA